jgi:hypothetical protein
MSTAYFVTHLERHWDEKVLIKLALLSTWGPGRKRPFDRLRGGRRRGLCEHLCIWFLVFEKLSVRIALELINTTNSSHFL